MATAILAAGLAYNTIQSTRSGASEGWRNPSLKPRKSFLGKLFSRSPRLTPDQQVAQKHGVLESYVTETRQRAQSKSSDLARAMKARWTSERVTESDLDFMRKEGWISASKHTDVLDRAGLAGESRAPVRSVGAAMFKDDGTPFAPLGTTQQVVGHNYGAGGINRADIDAGALRILSGAGRGRTSGG